MMVHNPMGLRGPVVLALVQGWGYRSERLGNVLAEAELPNYEQLWEAYPHALLQAAGQAVGVQSDTVGSSAAGYSTIAAGGAVEQASQRLCRCIEDGTFFENPVLKELVAAVRSEGRRLHLLGLVSDGHVISRERHYFALLALLQQAEVPGENVFVHAVLDGFDTPARSGINYLARCAAEMRRTGIGRVATLMGRNYGLSGGGGWEATERAYAALVEGAGRLVPSAIQALQSGYARGEDDLSLSPAVVLGHDGLPLGRLQDGDVLLCFNHRDEGSERLMAALLDPAFTGFRRAAPPPRLAAVTLAHWNSARALPVQAAFETALPPPSLGRIVTDAGLKVGLVGESAVAGRIEIIAEGADEERLLRAYLPSPPYEAVVDVPARLTGAITAQVVEWLERDAADLIVADYYHVDLAGHAGELDVARQAAEALDAALSPLVRAARRKGATVLLTACFGNVEEMSLPNTSRPNPAHTANPVPLLLIHDSFKGYGVDHEGEPSLADVGVTTAGLLGLTLPAATGRDLVATLTPLISPQTASDEAPTPLELTGLDALAMTIAAGRGAVGWYRRAGERASDSDSAAVYRALAHDEDRRLSTLERRYELLSSGEICPERRDNGVDALPPDADLDALTVLNAAIEEEWATYRLLTDLAARNLDAEGTAVLEQLAHEELDVFHRWQRLTESEAIRLLSAAMP